MLTAAEIMSGSLPTTKRKFTVNTVGEVELYRLPADIEHKTKVLLQDPKANGDDIEKAIPENIYYMLHGEFNSELAATLPSKLDTNQLTQLHTTGLFFIDLTQKNLESIEKN